MVHEENKHRRSDEGVFRVGDKVYVSSTNLRFAKGLSGKFIPRFVGPYTIAAADPATSTYTIDLPPHLSVHRRIHASKLRPHYPNDDSLFPSRLFSSPPPVVPASDSNEAEYVIEKVVDERVRRGKKEFRVRYLGYSSAEDQRRSHAELKASAAELLADFTALRKARSAVHPSSPRKRAQALVGALIGSFKGSFRGG